MKEHRTKLLIIGSGPAGYTAAIYAARANLNPIQVLGIQPGGQLMVTTDVENYPGFSEVIQGPWLMEQMLAQAQHVGTQTVQDMISRVDFSKRPFICEGEGGDRYIADTVIICTGAQAKWLGLESEEKYRGYGVSGCAVCDGFFFKNQEVAITGGGNTAVEEALYLTNFASRVTLIHRRDQLRAEKVLQDRLMENPKIQVIWNAVIEEILGEEEPSKNVTGVRLRDTQTNKLSTLAVGGVFIAIGHKPMTELFAGQIDLDKHGYIACTSGTTLTNIPGVFAAGDVQDSVYRQAVTAAGQGCMAALDAQRYLAEHP
ncbi:thioredoxin reductase [Caedimonas varicaedens]|jgi:thioredoxin reductase (NADPH)|uniref:Thioredoxin reductase n=1 Tax=Caedimonas varicaedens TaxID=1629334 RepID=A0A0K8MEY9_9PROT|nr:thioredoxin reductase [Caedimonas varicaedens]